MLRLLPLLTLLLPACTDKAADDTEDTEAPAATAPPVLVNEILASNLKTNMDDLGEFDDWIEIHNPSDAAVDLAGVYLSDDPAFPTAWPFPDGATVPAGGFLLVWCDDATGAEGLHATFKLDADGDQVVLSWVDGGADPERLDWVQFGAQLPDLSAARQPDGGDTWNTSAPPTPGASNG